MKVIAVVIPTYNEEKNIPLIYERVVDVFKEYKDSYRYTILFIDNFSTDSSRDRITELCDKDENVQAIFNASNFGFVRSTFYGLTQTNADATALLFADMQDPPELLHDFIKKWEEGFKVIIGIKNTSRENKLMYAVRKVYYSLLKQISEIDHISQFTGFGMYDKTLIDVLKRLDDPYPYLRGIIAELGFKRAEITYSQNAREHGKTSFNFFKLYDVAMLGITSYSRVVMRLATLFGFGFSGLCILITMITLIIKLIDWDYFSIGTAAIVIGVFFLGAVQLFFIGMLGEYILNINSRILKRPLVIEERRFNFRDEH